MKHGNNSRRRVQVFISSTYTDLREERQAIVEAVLRAGHIPAGMELFAAGSETQLDIIKRWIDESDIYVLLLGGRYGSLEPKSQRSYTEIEYRYASEKDKPLFAIILSDEMLGKKLRKVKNHKDIIELDHQEKYKTFRSHVMSKICRIVNESKDIHLAVMESILEIQRTHNLHGWVKSTAILKQIIFDRSQVDRELDTMENRLNNLREEAWISGNDCAFVVGSNLHQIRSALDRGVKLKILCVDPDCHADEMFTYIDPIFRERGDFKRSMVEIKTRLEKLKNQYSKNFEFRFLPILPAQGFFITEPGKSEGIVKVEIYAAKDFEPIKSRPHLIIPKELVEWRKYFISQFTNYWNIAHAPTH